MRNRNIEDVSELMNQISFKNAIVSEFAFSLVKQTLSLRVEKAQWVGRDLSPLATMRFSLSGWKRMEWQRLASVDEEYGEPIATKLYEPLKEISIRHGRYNILHIKGKGIHSNEWFDLKLEDIEKAELLFEQDDASNLCEAVRKEELFWATDLLSQGIDPNIPRFYCAGHYIETVYPLIKAVEQGNLQIVQLLIEKGADVNVSTQGCAKTALHAAFFIDKIVPQKLGDVKRKARLDEMVKYLVEQGAKVNVEACFYLAPLHLAVYDKNIEMVQYLIKHGADVNLVLDWVDENESRATAIGAAVQENNLEIVKCLIEHGANPSLAQDDWLTPIEEALEIGNKEIIHALESIQERVINSPLPKRAK
jgi:hypothetical protein